MAFLTASAGLALADTVTLSPSSVGNYDDWAANVGTKVDSVATDDGATSFVSDGTNNDRQSFLVSNAGLPAGTTINSVTVSAVAQGTGFVGSKKFAIFAEQGLLPSNRNAGGDISAPSSFATSTFAWTANPFTGLAWTLAEVNGWGTAFGVERTNQSGTVGVTQLFVTVDYTAPGTIVVHKVTDPVEDPQPFDFTPSYGDSFPLQGGDSNSQNVAPGPYTVSEEATSGWNLSDLTCTDPTDNSSVSLETKTATINVAAGETVDCTFTNTKLGSIIVHKQVVAPNGTTPVEDDHEFTVHLNGSEVGDTLSEGSDVTYSNLTPGTSYSVTETQDENYGTISYDGCTIESLAAGQDAECTITNTQLPAHLTVIKHVNNPNGGTAVSSDFTMSVDGTNVQPSDEFAGSDDGTEVTLDPGTFSVGESGPNGYSQLPTDGNCGSDPLTSNETATCTITNSDIPSGDGAITVIKHVENDNGGDADAGDFQVHVTTTDGETVTDVSGSPASGSESGTPFTLEAGSSYTVSEDTPTDGYSETGISCTPVGGGDAITGETSVTIESLADQQAYVCTITNDDIAPKLTLVKVVDNTAGELTVGTSTAADWTLAASADGPTDISGTSGSEDVTDVSVHTGTYTLSESGGSEGYTPSETWSCVVNDDDAVDENSIELGLGDVATCTMTNTAQPALLTIVKKTDEASGDGAFNFTIHSTGDTASFSDSLSLNTESGSNHTATSSDIQIPAGTFDVSEVNIGEGWHLADIACVYDNESVGTSDIVAGVEHISVGNGDHVTCTFTNTTQGTLIVKKVVVNDDDGTATADDFSFVVNDGDPVAFEADGENHLVVASSTYTITEPAADGYTTTYDNCTAVDIAAGDEVTCTITNNDIAPTPPTPEPTQTSGGGGGGNGPPGLIGGGGGQVLGASTSNVGSNGQVLGSSTSTVDNGASCDSTLLLTKYLRRGKANDPAEVKKLQQFLNGEMGSGLPTTGFFGPLTEAAVKAFQAKYAADILAPWGITDPTGYVYKTTMWKINMIICASLNTPKPQVP